MPGVVQRGPHQRVHAGIAADAADAELVDHLGHARDHRAAFGDQEAPGLDRQPIGRMRRLDLRKASGPGIDIEGLIVRLVRDRQAAADVDGVDAADAISQSTQLVGDLVPVLRAGHATAQVRVQAGDARIQLARLGDEFVETFQRQAELGALAAGLDLVVVAVAAAQVHAQPQRTTAKHLRPVLQRLHVVQGDVDAALQREGVFRARREARGEQDPLHRKVGRDLGHAFDFPT